MWTLIRIRGLNVRNLDRSRTVRYGTRSRCRTRTYNPRLNRASLCRIELSAMTRRWKLSRQQSELRSGRHSCRGRMGARAAVCVGFARTPPNGGDTRWCPRFRPQVDDRVCTRFLGRRAYALLIQVLPAAPCRGRLSVHVSLEGFEPSLAGICGTRCCAINGKDEAGASGGPVPTPAMKLSAVLRWLPGFRVFTNRPDGYTVTTSPFDPGAG